jgi:hypothetical protein
VNVIDPYFEIDHVSGRWLTSLVRFSEGRKLYPGMSTGEFERKAREFKALIAVGTQADLYIDPNQFETMLQISIADEISATPLQELNVTHDRETARNLQERIRSEEARYHSLLASMAYFRHNAAAQDDRTGTMNQQDLVRLREAEINVKASARVLVKLKEELAALIANDDSRPKRSPDAEPRNSVKRGRKSTSRE